MKAHIDQHLGEVLARHEVQYVFGMRVYPELDAVGIQPINVHHETGAALMAYGYARVSGKPGIVALNRPGTPNIIMGLAEAFNSSVPVIVLEDGLPFSSQGHNALYEHDLLGMLRPVTKWIGDTAELSQAPSMLCSAFRIATTGRPRPVVVNIRGASPVRAADQFLDMEVSCSVGYTTFPAQRLAPDPSDVQRAADLLATAERPCIVAGGGVNLSRAWDELRELVELGGFPVATTISGKGAFDDRHPLSVGATGGVVGGKLGRGRVAERIVKESDVVLLVGSRTTEMATSRWTVPSPASKIIHIDVDPQEIGRTYQTEAAVIGDAKLALAALAEALRHATIASKGTRLSQIRQLTEEWLGDNEARANPTEVPIDPARLVREVGQCVDANTILVSDGSSPFRWAASHIFVTPGPTFITPRGTGAIGTGLPMAIGAKLAAPDKQVICLEGDGGLMCGILTELEVAAKHGIAIVVVVFNNGTYLLEKKHLEDHPLRSEMDFLPGLNFANIGRELGCEGIRVERPDQIRPALAQALASGKPTVVDVVINSTQAFPA